MTTFVSGAMLTAAQLNALQQLFRGAISGLVPSNGTDATNDLDFSAGVARDDGNAGNIVAGATMTKRMDADWASGSGNGGRASGAAAWANAVADDWHAFLIGQSDDQTAYDFIIDDDADGGNIAADVGATWDLKRRVFSIRSNSSGTFPVFSARERAGGGLEVLIAPAFEFEKSWSGGVDDGPQTGTLAAPPGGIQVEALCGVLLRDITAGTASTLLVTALDVADTAPSGATASVVATIVGDDGGGSDTRGYASFRVRTSTSRTFRYRGSSTTTDHRAGFDCHGWIDERV